MKAKEHGLKELTGGPDGRATKGNKRVKSKYEMKDGEGSLFKNDNRAKDTDPDVNGSVRVGGVDYVINGWKKNSKSGLSYMKLSLRPKSEAAGKAKPAFNDDVGF